MANAFLGSLKYQMYLVKYNLINLSILHKANTNQKMLATCQKVVFSTFFKKNTLSLSRKQRNTTALVAPGYVFFCWVTFKIQYMAGVVLEEFFRLIFATFFSTLMLIMSTLCNPTLVSIALVNLVCGTREN